jgi:class 3 adenylate cyclase
MRWLRRLRARGRDPEVRTLLQGPATATVSRTATTEAIVIDDPGALAASLVRPAFGHLTVVEGPPRLLSRRFALRDVEISIGRTDGCYVAIPDQRVSRLHAQLVREGEALFLVHRSQTNQTFLNGTQVTARAALHDGDQIQLADRVILRLEAPALRREAATTGGGLREAMEARVALEDRIARQFVRDGSFLDVDVVGSYQLKAAEDRPERVVVSFERFRALVEGVVDEHGGQVLNSNGDEVMAFFAGADAALAGARAMLSRLPAWNAAENRLANDFQVRIGIHTGRSPVDLQRGVAYSPVLDGAGHLQKAAPIGGILLSRSTYDALTDRAGLAPRGVVTQDGIEAFGLEGDPP